MSNTHAKSALPHQVTRNMGGGSTAVMAMDIHVAGRVKLRRLELGVSIERFARGVNVSRQQVEKWERGANRLTSGRLHEISILLNINPGWFYEGFAGGVPQAGSPGTSNMFTSAIIDLVAGWNRLLPDQRNTVKHVMKAFLSANQNEDEASLQRPDEEEEV